MKISKNAKGGSGHGVGGVNGSTAAFILMTVILFLLITFHLGFKVYYSKKFFSRDWEKAYGPSIYSEDLEDSENENEMA